MTDSVLSSLNNAKKALMQSRFSDAIALCQQSLSTNQIEDTDKDCLYIIAVAQRMAAQPQEALNTLTKLLTHFPDYGRGYQEQAYCFKMLGDEQAMASAFYRATSFNPTLLTAWRELVNVYQRTGNNPALKLANEHIKNLSSLPKPLLGAMDLLHEGQVSKAEKVCRDFLQQNKHHPEAMMLLAEIGMQLKVYHDAEFLLESCVALYPQNEAATTAYQSVLSKLGKYPQAIALARKRLNKDPQNYQAKVALSHALVGVGELDEAINLYRTLLTENESKSALWLQYGHALKANGATNEAVKAYEQAAIVNDDFGDAYWSLANTKTYQFTDPWIDKMAKVADGNNVALEDKIHGCFAMGKAIEDRQDFQRAFHYYAKGNRLKQQTLKFDINRTEQALKAQARACDPSLFASRTGCDAKDPIFIVGLPRAGSTLLEQILASHSQVDGTMELHDILGIASGLSHQHKPYPFNLAELTEDKCKELGEQYLAQTRAYRQRAPFFIDKMPNNFIHIGLIKRILPNAKIIDARRDPIACCFSGFKQLFADGQEFTYSLTDIGRYYNAYVALMDHWHSVLPGEILTVQHEDVIHDLEGQVRRILNYCELPFEEACLQFHKTQRVIKTPSSEQVRQPIYRSGMTQWKGFEPYLAPLLDVLDLNQKSTL